MVLTRLTERDEETFRQMYGDIGRFCASWLYVLRFARDEEGKLGYKFDNGDEMLPIGMRKDSVHILIPAGKTKIDLEGLCSHISSSGKRVFVRKAFPEFSEQLKDGKCFEDVPDEMRPILEDDTHPEQSLPLDGLLTSMDKPPYKPLRKALRQFTEQPELLTNGVLGEGLQGVMDFVAEWASGDKNKFDAYANMLAFAFQEKREGVLPFLFRLERKFIGLYLICQLTRQDCGLYCGITSREYRGQTEALDIAVFKLLHEAGFRRVFLGGAETVGVINYIKKFQPVHEETRSLLYKAK